jgi:hypothetical protein
VANQYNISIAGSNADTRQGGMRLTTKERILMIRLVEKLEMHPTFGKALGIEATGAIKNQNAESNPKSLTIA